MSRASFAVGPSSPGVGCALSFPSARTSCWYMREAQISQRATIGVPHNSILWHSLCVRGAPK